MTYRLPILLALSAATLAAPVAAATVDHDRRMDHRDDKREMNRREMDRREMDKRGDKQRDHDAARQAVLRREVLPLPRILTLVSGYQAGDVIEVELKGGRGPLFYDVDVLEPSGVVKKLKIDARNGALIANTAKGA